MNSRFTTGIAVVVAGLVTASASAGMLTYEGLGYSTDSTGELEVTTVGVPGQADGVTWKTFCIEWYEDIFENTTYNAYVNTNALKGGVSDPAGDPLGPETAWLYQQYLNGATVAGYDFSAMNGTTARALQFAIWKLENEVPATWGYYYNNVSGAPPLVSAALSSGATDIGNVRVLNLYTLGDNEDAQDVLTTIPVPGAALLGVLGLGIVARIKRSVA